MSQPRVGCLILSFGIGDAPTIEQHNGDVNAAITGRLTESLDTYRACLAMDPANAEALYSVGWCLVQLGDYAGALDNFSRSLKLVDDPTRRPDLLAARFYRGQTTRDDLEHALERESAAQSMLTYMYPLLDHPDPRQRDPKFVLRILGERREELNSVDWPWVVETVAKVRLEDWAGAHAAIESHFTPPAAQVLTASAYDFLRSLIYSKLGQGDAARECYARGMAEWNVHTRGNAGLWEHSDVMRWRRESEAAMAK